jgi:Toxin SymE, type I toxin-antitoxin system
VFAALSGYLFKIFKVMRTHKKRETPKRPQVRNLKIQPRTRYNRYSQKDVPEIRFCGNWLHQLGFELETRVTITTMPKLLIIRAAD